MEIIVNKIEIGTEIQPTVLELTVDLHKGLKGDSGQAGIDGRSVVSIDKTDTQELTDTYTITYSDDTTSTFDVVNGYNGADGKSAYQSAVDGGYTDSEEQFNNDLQLVSTKQDALGFMPENVANKKTTITDSDTDYPTTKSVKTALAGKSDTSHNHTLANLTERSYNSLTDKPNLDAYIDIIDVQFWKNTENGFPDGMFGDIWYNLENNKLYVFMDGLSWVLLPFDWKFYLNKDENSDFFGKYFVYNGAELSIVPDGLVLGETSQTAFDGLRGKAAYDHANETGNPHGTTAEQVGAAASNHNHALANLTDVQLTTPLTNITTNDSILMWDAETNKAVRILKSDFYAVLDDYFATKSDIGDINTILDDINGEVI